MPDAPGDLTPPVHAESSISSPHAVRAGSACLLAKLLPRLRVMMAGPNARRRHRPGGPSICLTHSIACAVVRQQTRRTTLS